MFDKPIVVTKVSCKAVWNERWSRVLACECETEEYGHMVVHFTKRAVESLGIDSKTLRPTSGFQKHE